MYKFSLTWLCHCLVIATTVTQVYIIKICEKYTYICIHRNSMSSSLTLLLKHIISDITQTTLVTLTIIIFSQINLLVCLAKTLICRKM